jgi:prolyl 4-hydroxylase
MPEDKAWCAFIDCDSADGGVTFKPIAGNAVFWENLQQHGGIHPDTLHAGLPVLSGQKIGMNIWTWILPPDVMERKMQQI